MAGLMKREPRGEATDVFSRFDRLFEEWARMMPFRPMAFPRWLEAGDLMRVEEYREPEPWWCGPICPASTPVPGTEIPSDYAIWPKRQTCAGNCRASPFGKKEFCHHGIRDGGPAYHPGRHLLPARHGALARTALAAVPHSPSPQPSIEASANRTPACLAGRCASS
jgi:hypothetical protein